MIIGFFLWSIVGIAFLALGIFDCVAKTEVPAGFWANAKTIPVEEEDVPAYNRAVGKLWIVYGLLFLLFGLPLLAGQNSPLIFITVIGTMVETIITMVVYTVVIENKYRKRGN